MTQNYNRRVHTAAATRYTLNDVLHRIGGPAIEHAGGRGEYYLNGKRCRPPALARLGVCT